MKVIVVNTPKRILAYKYLNVANEIANTAAYKNDFEVGSPEWVGAFEYAYNSPSCCKQFLLENMCSAVNNGKIVNGYIEVDSFDVLNEAFQAIPADCTIWVENPDNYVIAELAAVVSENLNLA